MKIILYKSEIPVQDLEHFIRLISCARDEAYEKRILSVIFLKADNGNELGITVGSNETVLSFEDGSKNPPYLASKGDGDAIYPVLTCYAYFTHHTEFPRKYVIPFTAGLAAAHEFFETNKLPKIIEWVEV